MVYYDETYKCDWYVDETYNNDWLSVDKFLIYPNYKNKIPRYISLFSGPLIFGFFHR